MKIVGVIQARTGSTRYPGKILADIAGWPMIRWCTYRLAWSAWIDEVVVATPKNEPRFGAIVRALDPIFGVTRAPIHLFATHIEDDTDLLARHVDVAREFGADIIVRVPSDNPFVDPFVVDKAINAVAQGDVLAAENARGWRAVGRAEFPDGLGAEVYDADLLREFAILALPAYEREHVWPAMHQPAHPKWLPRSGTWPHGFMRFDLDRPEQLRRLDQIGEWMNFNYGRAFTVRQLAQCPIELLREPAEEEEDRTCH